jgi:predicted peptidase
VPTEVRGALALCLLLALPRLGVAQPVQTGFLDRVVTIDGEEYRYQVYVPRSFSTTARWPIVLSLHGGGEYGSDGIRQTAGALANAIRRFPERLPAIAIFPQARADKTPGWHQAGGRAALAALDKTLAEFSGDPARVYLTGYSAGGNGTLFLASRHPDRFAALLVVCPFVREFRGTTSGVLYPSLAMPGDADPYASVARRIAHIPAWLFHGDADATVPVDESRKMLVALKAAGADARYTELPGVNHDAWTPAYARAEVFEWLLRQRRTPGR